MQWVQVIKSNQKIYLAVVAIFIVVTIALLTTHPGEALYIARRIPILRRFFKADIETAVKLYGPAARVRLAKSFKIRNIAYPPDKIAYIALKSERQLLVYASSTDEKFKYVCSYPILGASGRIGPKLREGDFQVPEGIYQLTLEPDTPYHVALRLDYPNASDLARAKIDHRLNPGSDILVHGTTGSVGCIAVGDQASEDLFVLAFDCHNKSLPLIIAPNDLRVLPAPPSKKGDPIWLNDLYAEILAQLGEFPLKTKE
jgi:hypothetical protein